MKGEDGDGFSVRFNPSNTAFASSTDTLRTPTPRLCLSNDRREHPYPLTSTLERYISHRCHSCSEIVAPSSALVRSSDVPGELDGEDRKIESCARAFTPQLFSVDVIPIRVCNGRVGTESSGGM